MHDLMRGCMTRGQRQIAQRFRENFMMFECRPIWVRAWCAACDWKFHYSTW